MDLRDYLLARKFGGGSGNGTWGSITGTLSDQTDLQNALNDKLDTSKVYNGLDQISPGYALDARQGKAIADGYIPITNNAGFHNSIYRGKYLGTSVTAAQYSAIDAGTFEDLFIGDYWTINSVNWRIAAFDYWLDTGGTVNRCTTHHVVIIPDSCLANGSMNSTDVVTGAYIGSDYYTGRNSNTAKATVESAVNGAFGSTHILVHYDRPANAVTNGYETGGTWLDSAIDLMSEIMVYGCQIYHNCVNGTNYPTSYQSGKSQFPLFRHDHSKITICGEDWWLRDVARAQSFAAVGGSGVSSEAKASASKGIRPMFAIRKEAS